MESDMVKQRRRRLMMDIPERTEKPGTSSRSSWDDEGSPAAEPIPPKRPRTDFCQNLKKSDVQWILQKRGVWWGRSNKSMSKDRLLQDLIPEPTFEELEEVKNRPKLAGKLFPGLKIKDLRERLKKLGEPYSGLDKTELAEKLYEALEKGKTEEPDLDEYQQDVVNRWEDRELIINAGPGSGKTTTLCALITHILQHRPESRVLVLAFNRCASAELTTRLSKRGAALLQRTKAFGADLPSGCLVSTFDSFGFWCVPGAEDQLRRASSLSTTDYRLRLEQSARILATVIGKEEPARRWDWVVVDEAQDLNNTHASIVDSLRQSCQHLVVAGDPRQELYPGATWFSNTWKEAPKENRAELKYNYRSAPQIVDVINTFSKHNFPELHHDQIAARTNCQATVDFRRVESPEKCGELAGTCLAMSAPSAAYAISPVTVKKFCTEPVTNTIRQVVFEEKPGSHTFVTGETNSPSSRLPDMNAYVIGTSRGLKGTERSRVVIYGVTAPFCDYGISRTALAKLFYVAISRAKDHLHIIADAPLPVNNPLVCFSQFPLAQATVTRKMTLPQDLTVTDLCKEDYIWMDKNEHEQIETPLSPVKVDSQDDSDFVGLYLESVVAHCAGVMPEDVDNVATRVKKGRQQEDFYIENDQYNFNLPRDGKAEELVQQLRTGWETNPCYSLTAARRSVEIGRLWTKSSRLQQDWEQHRDACKTYAEKIQNLLTDPSTDDPTGINYQCRNELPVVLHRSCQCAGTVVGVSDFSSRSGVVEVKFVQNVTEEHRIQAAMYAALHSVPHAFLVNLYSGNLEKIPAVRLKELTSRARAKLALNHARNVASSTLAWRQMPLPPDFVSTCCIAVDLEYISDLSGQRNTEIGAVAFTLDGQILGTFHRVLKGVRPVDSPEEVDDQSESGQSESDESEDSDVVEELNISEEFGLNGHHASLSNLTGDPAAADDGQAITNVWNEGLDAEQPPGQLQHERDKEEEVLDMKGTPEETFRPSRQFQQGPEGFEEYDNGEHWSIHHLSSCIQREEDVGHELKMSYAVRSHFLGPSIDYERIREVRKLCGDVARDAHLEEDPVGLADDPATPAPVQSPEQIHESLTGLKVFDYQALKRDQQRARQKFCRWVKRVSRRRSFIVWSGTDDRSLGLSSLGESCDVMSMYRAWLKQEDMARRTGLKLVDCVQQVLGPAWPFEPHRAFEDAVATAAVFLALTKSA